jgi:serine/threonine-protein kinase
MDFGIARALASGASTMTQTSAVIGTAQYLSPEQARGEQVDARSDVYATGCVVYELLTGRPPFVGDNPVSVAYQHVREDAKPPSAVNRDVSPDVDAIVLKALAKNPLNRYQSAAEMRADLLRAAAGRPVMATPIMREAPTAIVGTAPRNGPYGSRPTSPARVGNPQRRRTSTWVMVTLTVLGLVALIALGVGLYLTNRTQNTTVPNLVGQNVTNASALLQQNQLNLGSQTQVHNTTCTLGNVIATDPGAGRAVAENSTVNLSFCAGPGLVQGGVPAVTGLTEDQAVQQLKNAGLVPVVTQADSTAAEGTVVGVKPAEQSQVSVGAKVTLQVSKGNQAKLVNLVGMTQASATSQLKSLGFSNVQVVPNTVADPSKYGIVTGQAQTAGKTLFKNTKIIIYVGQAPTAPPSTPPSSPSPSPSN